MKHKYSLRDTRPPLSVKNSGCAPEEDYDASVHDYENVKYEGQSNENLKYFLSRNLLNTNGTQSLYFSM